MDEKTLPVLDEALLDPESLETVLNDLAELTTIESVLLKGAPDEHATETQRDVRSLWTLLTAGRIRAAQVRYRYEDKTWCDTLLVTDGGVTLVRMCQG